MQKTIKIENIVTFSYVPSPKLCASFAEAAAFCLDYHQHSQYVEFEIKGDVQGLFELKWTPTSTQVADSYVDMNRAIEDGAVCLAIWIIERTTTYKIIQRSQSKTGIDYWLGNKSDNFPFQKRARLEVSGLLKGKLGRINQRLKEKVKQTRLSQNSQLPAFVIIIEFSHPRSKIVKI